MAKMFDDSWSRDQSAQSWGAGAGVAKSHAGPINAIRRQLRRRLPVREIMLFVLAVASFKIFLFFDLGAANYGSKMAALSEGNLLERVAGRAMVLDPVSEWVVDGVRYGTW